MSRRPLHVGLLCSELFDQRAGGFGGFGFAALRLIEVLGGGDDGRFRFTAIFPVPPGPEVPDGAVHGVPVVSATGDLRRDARTFQRLGLDLVVSVDWQPRFLVPLLATGATPVLIWFRDPRSPAEWDHIRSLQLPSDGPGRSDPRALDELEPGDNRRSARSLRTFLASARARRRPVEIAVPTLGLRPELVAQYGIEPRRLWQLGTPLPGPPAAPERGRDGGPLHAVMLGRLDPVKRPWLFWALAQARPDWRFTAVGQARTGAWEPPAGPANLTHVPHLTGSAKAQLLAEADVLVNTSIHEGLPVSVCEALTAGVAVLATTDVAGVVARFGEVVPNVGGDGLPVVPDLAAGLDRLAGDPDRRRRIAVEGARWATSVHAADPFLAQLAQILDVLRLPDAAVLVRRRRADEPTPPPRPRVIPPSRPRARPTFLVVGAARAGTTALHNGLVAHPGVHVPPAKELRHFITDGHRPDYSGPYDEHVVNSRSTWDSDAYARLFHHAPEDRPTGEVSPLYLDVDGAAERIVATLPHVRIVVVVRDPAERAYSQWRLHRWWGQEPLSFRDALAAEEERMAAGWSPLYAYRGRGFYAAHLDPYRKALGGDRLLVLRFEDLVEDLPGTVDRLVAFVGGRPGWGGGASEALSASVNSAVGEPRSVRLAARLRGAPRWPAADRLRQWNERSATLDGDLRTDLVTGYLDDIARLEETTGLDLRAWRRTEVPER